jgi:predicted transglutaminase-like protease
VVGVSRNFWFWFRVSRCKKFGEHCIIWIDLWFFKDFFTPPRFCFLAILHHHFQPNFLTTFNLFKFHSTIFYITNLW